MQSHQLKIASLPRLVKEEIADFWQQKSSYISVTA